ncbi:hypothetical protein [Pelomonas sp. Root1444]|jgi:hypothetical protein|uniref:hypothetical protein n=1 Tax=Pelomonas sp. Root1444 TaxID=1736464 RepID=UPI000703767A|nr:hypothetical protein [Pelomonas sp. Root1444]KQY85414.1 hypothetical protein ASD35_22625 [Pelomonas sp. Root1444]
MNRISTTTSRTRLQAASAAALVALTALTGAAWMTISAPDDGPAVIQLERVVIEGTRSHTAEVKQLPRVVVVGRRDASADGAQVASACVAPAVC